jgi:exosortase
MSATIERKGVASAALPGGESSEVARHIQAVVIGVLLVIAYWPILLGIYASWSDEHAYMEHGILVVPAAAYMVWTKWGKLARVPREPSAWGVLLIFGGALQATLGIASQWVWLSRMAFLVSLVGSLLAVYGPGMVRELAYPLGTLIFMITPPNFVYERLTLSLQLLASRMGEISLEALGFSVMREGNILELVGIKLSVEEACSGIRSLLSILFMCTLYDYFFVRGNLMRVLILVMAIPAAILGNAGRILATGIASQYNRDLVHGAVHEAFGYVSVVVAGVSCIVLHIVMLHIQKAWRSRHA